jgi:hypothetical protein
VFESFDLQGTLDTETMGLAEEPAPGPREDELPLTWNILDFPD